MIVIAEREPPVSVKADIARYEAEHSKITDTKALDELHRRLIRPHIQAGRIDAAEKRRLTDMTEIRRTDIIEARPRHLRPPSWVRP